MNPSERESSYNDDSSTILLLQDENPPEEVDAPERSMNRKQLSFYISQFTATLIELNISYNSLGQWQTPLLCTLFEHLMDSPLRSLNLAFNNFSTKSDIEIEKFNTIQLPKSLRTLIFSGNILTQPAMLIRKIPFQLHYLSVLNCQLERCGSKNYLRH